MRQIQESGLARLNTHMVAHDTGVITAFRKAYSLKENKQRNRSLASFLSSYGYGLTEVSGIYVEDYGTSEATEVSEDVYFVVDLEDSGNLEEDLRYLGEKFDQDSILFIPRPADMSILWGTNDAEFPGFGKKVSFNHRGMGKSGEFMTKVKGRPFIFESFNREIIKPEGYLGKWAMSETMKKNWRDLE
jgi:hypothetical protein